jgi:hypothetical protein
MNNTPETDAESITPSGFEADEVSAEFARKLERERDEAREKMADALQEVDLRTLDFERIKQERDEAREKYATEATEHMLNVNKLCGERDEARFLLKAAQSALDAIHLEVGGWIKTMKENTD